MGFDTLPNEQIMLNSVILTPPYTFNAIGDREVLDEALNAPQGIVDKMNASFDNFKYTLAEKDLIEIGQI